MVCAGKKKEIRDKCVAQNLGQNHQCREDEEKAAVPWKGNW